MENKNISNLQDLNLAEKLKSEKCHECDQVFNDEELKEKNYTVWFDEDFKWLDQFSGKKITLSINYLTHEYTNFYDCPSVETCQGCFKKFRLENVKNGLYEEQERGETTYWCEPCFNKKYGEYLKARAERKKLTQGEKEALRIVQKALNEHLNSEYHKTPGNGHYGVCKGSECEGYKQTLESYGYDRDN